jgi:hypothetical protein
MKGPIAGITRIYYRSDPIYCCLLVSLSFAVFSVIPTQGFPSTPAAGRMQSSSQDELAESRRLIASVSFKSANLTRENQQSGKEPLGDLRLNKFAARVEDPLLRSDLALAVPDQSTKDLMVPYYNALKQMMGGVTG